MPTAHPHEKDGAKVKTTHRKFGDDGELVPIIVLILAVIIVAVTVINISNDSGGGDDDGVETVTCEHLGLASYAIDAFGGNLNAPYKGDTSGGGGVSTSKSDSTTQQTRTGTTTRRSDADVRSDAPSKSSTKRHKKHYDCD